MRRLPIRSESGTALVMAMAFMAFGVAVVTGSLGLASTIATDSQVKTRILKSQYSAIGADQYAAYRLLYEPGYADGLEEGVEDRYAITLNGSEVTISTTKLADSTDQTPPPSADSSRRLQVSKEVNPTSSDPDVETTYTYTITVENRDDQAESLNKIHDELPPGFTHATSTSDGVTMDDPTVNGQTLTWDLGNQNVTLESGESTWLSFEADANVGTGTYCNEAWAEPGGKKTSSGKTALITVGSPSSTLCQGTAHTITVTADPNRVLSNSTSTVTYAINVDNIGTDPLNMTEIRHLLPPDFAYELGTTQGDITSADPTVTDQQGRERLKWEFSPAIEVPSGTSATLTFDAMAEVPAGDYYSEVWITFDEYPNEQYSWPTALVQSMGAFSNTSTDGDTTVTSELWVGADSQFVSDWEISR